MSLCQSSVAPLRLLLLKRSHPNLYSRLTLLMDHNEDRNGQTSQEEHQVIFRATANLLTTLLNGNDNERISFNREEIEKAIGIFLTNGFQNVVPLKDDKVEAKVCRLMHACQSLYFGPHTCVPRF